MSERSEKRGARSEKNGRDNGAPPPGPAREEQIAEGDLPARDAAGVSGHSFSILAPHRAWIEAALPYCYCTHTIEDVERQIAEGRLQFWPGERCAVVTEIVDYPRLRALNFFLVGGDLNELIEQMEPAIVEWARRLGCTRIAQTGRKGWGRVLAPLGYQTTLSVMIRDLD